MPASSAETFCVGAHFGCRGDEFKSVQEALNAASAGGDPRDTVRIGPGTFDIGNTIDISGNEVAIVGSGTRRTRLVANSGSYGLQLSERDSDVKMLRIHIEQTGAAYRGLKLQGDASRLLVTAVGDSDAGGVQMEGADGSETVKLTQSTVKLPVDTQAIGVDAVGLPEHLIRGCRVRGNQAIRANATGTLTEIEHTVIIGRAGVSQANGGVEIDDSLIRVKPAPAGFTEAGLIAYGFDGTSALVANHVTEIGTGVTEPAGTGSIGVATAVTGDARTATLRNSILFGNEYDIRNNGGSVTLDYTRWKTTPSSVSDMHGTDANPRFTGSYRLRPSSPLIDRGQPFGLLPGEPPLDLAGNDRITNGDGRHGARRDMGAYEFQR